MLSWMACTVVSRRHLIVKYMYVLHAVVKLSQCMHAIQRATLADIARVLITSNAAARM
jgi:hypothetical protein